KAPLSKSLLLVPSAISILLTLLFQHYQKFFAYNLQAIKEDFQIWRLVCGRTICLDLKDTFCSSLLIYNFRIFERRYGSRKFSSFLLGAWMLSALFDLLLVEITQYIFGITINSLPSGFLGPVFALFVPFYSSIPRVQVTQVLGHFSITNKTLVYILGLQLLTSGSYIWILALSGLVSLIVLKIICCLKHFYLYSLCSVSGLKKNKNYRVSIMFLSLTFQMYKALSACRENRRPDLRQSLSAQNLLDQLCQLVHSVWFQGGMINWNRLFPPLRHRHNANYQDHRPSEQDIPPPTEVSEEQVARLMEMGFSRGDALEALRASNNDLNVATNFLLQH
ncbi:Ubiquitin-associated domain-containing protein 2, partial [Calypte anna]